MKLYKEFSRGSQKWTESKIKSPSETLDMSFLLCEDIMKGVDKFCAVALIKVSQVADFTRFTCRKYTHAIKIILSFHSSFP